METAPWVADLKSVGRKVHCEVYKLLDPYSTAEENRIGEKIFLHSKKNLSLPMMTTVAVILLPAVHMFLMGN